MQNILLFNTANSGGGAEKIAYSLTKELHQRGFHSRMMVRRADYEADELARELVVPVPGSERLYSIGNFLDDVLSTQYLFYLPTWRLPFMQIVRDADVIHFHNLHGYYFNQLVAPVIIRRKPVVWTMHDMWPFTGKCTHSFSCDRYTQRCGKCPQLSAYPRLRRDTSRFHLWLKKLTLGSRPFVIVSPSEWLKTHIERSILKSYPVFVVPSPIDVRLYFPEPKEIARQKLGIPVNKKVLLFVASWVNSIPSKGLDVFLEMLQILYGRHQDLFTLVVGHLEGHTVLGEHLEGKETGWVSDPQMMRSCYSAADIFVSPTLAENSSCTIVEAMACGIPIVAYASGGVPEQVVDGLSGLLAAPGDKRSLLEGIEVLLTDGETRRRMGDAAEERARANYAMEGFVEKHLHVYDQAKRMKML